MHDGPVSYRPYQVFFKTKDKIEHCIIVNCWCEYGAKKIAESILNDAIITRIV